jgi:hypothetical protein
MEVEQTSATVEAMPSTEPEMRGGAIKDRRDERNRVVEPGLVRPPVEQLQRAKIAHDFGLLRARRCEAVVNIKRCRLVRRNGGLRQDLFISCS